MCAREIVVSAMQLSTTLSNTLGTLCIQTVHNFIS
jgi:hypothetical protein